MIKLTSITLAAGIALLAVDVMAQQGSADKEPATSTALVSTAEATKTATTQPENASFKNEKEKLSYALGVDLARKLKWQRISVDEDVLTTALKDTLAGNKVRLSDEEVAQTLKAFEEDQKRDFEHAKTMMSEKNRRAGEELFAANLKKPDVVTLPSGLQYKILKRGDGKKPTLEDQVVCQYKGALLDGTEFDSSDKKKEPATLPVKGLIKGWSEALQLMAVGSKWQLFVPPQLAYGEKIVGGIGPNATLVFEVELLSIQDKPQTASAAR
jgi:FKBP-type peptidyl-prolyl cis-trans isomerase